MQNNKIVVEYWRDNSALEYRKIHKPNCKLLPGIKKSNEHLLDEYNIAEVCILLVSSPYNTACNDCLPDAL